MGIINAEKQLKTMNRIFAIAGGLWACWTVWLIIRNIQHPRIAIKDVDYTKGEATLTIGGKDEKLYPNSTLSAGADWGVRFKGDTDDTINRIELVNNDLVHDTLHAK